MADVRMSFEPGKPVVMDVSGSIEELPIYTPALGVGDQITITCVPRNAPEQVRSMTIDVTAENIDQIRAIGPTPDDPTDQS